MTASKFPNVIAAPIYDDYSAELTAEHNNSNVLCFGTALLGTEYIINLLEKFLNSHYQHGRHQERVDMLIKILNENNDSKLEQK